MIILPAIDIQKGQCVRLRQGLEHESTVYGDSPLAMAKSLVEQGAKYLHIVDLDGAFAGDRQSSTVIKAIAQAVDIPIEVGGGIRSTAAVQDYLQAGVARVIIGSRALEDPQWIDELIQAFGSDKLAISVDAKNGMVATRGWVETSSMPALDFIKLMKNKGIKTFIYTDISRDGMLTGPNFEALFTAHQLGDIQIIASGGMSSVQDLEQLAAKNIYGAITGRALYEGKITMADIRKLQGE